MFRKKLIWSLWSAFPSVTAVSEGRRKAHYLFILLETKARKSSKFEHVFIAATFDRLRTRDRCYDFLNIFAKTFCEKIDVFNSKQSKILKKVDHNSGI
jgi:hypothetical protein